jgi:hypothetical protein
MGEGLYTADGMSETVVAADLVVLVVGDTISSGNVRVDAHRQPVASLSPPPDIAHQTGSPSPLTVRPTKAQPFDVAMTHIDWMSHTKRYQTFYRPQAPSSLNFSANGFLLKNKFIVTIQQQTRAKVRHVPV